MKKDSELKKAYDFSVRGVVGNLTLLMSILSTIRFFVDVYQLPLTGLLQNILKTYQVVFHTCVDILFIWFPYMIPPWGKDIIIFYSLFAFIYQRVIFKQVIVNYRHPWIIRSNYKNSKTLHIFKSSLSLVAATLLWPFRIREVFSKPYLVVANGAHGPSALYFSGERPTEGRWQSNFYFGDARLMMLVRLVSIVMGALIVMLFNYAFSI